MSKKIVLIILVLITLLSGCQRIPKAEKVKVTEEEAKFIVQQFHEKNSTFGEIKIISIKHINNEYEVKWDRESNCENGTDHVNDKDGSMGTSEIIIC